MAKEGRSQKNILLAIVVLLVVVIGLLVFIVLKPATIGSRGEAEKSGQDVLKDIGDIKTTLEEIKGNLKK